ncbi:GNAT family N-acetyltransferase [Paenibacillus polygoni]|uniref:GNAT family N-acetyltransferase n=1 Tax=Paenibacillus polygoni TaxID=3050112 RepID=A0ABY8X7Z9_9BACL|nr:GNAT family N-acetyltransferase [Paenibacillus polygoni]WIV21183.1 GNAT family N-acetyltransferase [Paenibacillus polygoni]
MMLKISAVSYEDKLILQNLIQLYRYDSSEYDGHVLNKHGLYQYKYLDHQWTDEYRRTFFIYKDEELAGFALIMLGVPREFVKLSDVQETNVMSDFFVLRKYRGQGVGKQAAFDIFDKYPAAWEIRQTQRNHPANQFWNKVINEHTNGSYKEEYLNGSWDGPVQCFQSNKYD